MSRVTYSQPEATKQLAYVGPWCKVHNQPPDPTSKVLFWHYTDDNLPCEWVKHCPTCDGLGCKVCACTYGDKSRHVLNAHPECPACEGRLGWAARETRLEEDLSRQVAHEHLRQAVNQAGH